MVWAEIKCTVYVVLPKRLINQFKHVKESRHQEALKAYCPDIYTMKKKSKRNLPLVITFNTTHTDKWFLKEQMQPNVNYLASLHIYSSKKGPFIQ